MLDAVSTEPFIVKMKKKRYNIKFNRNDMLNIFTQFVAFAKQKLC